MNIKSLNITPSSTMTNAITSTNDTVPAPQGANTLEPTTLTQLPENKETPVVHDEDLSDLIDELNQNVQSVNRELKFSYNERTGRVVIQVLNGDTEEVIREIPPEKARWLAQRLQDANSSGLLETKA